MRLPLFSGSSRRTSRGRCTGVTKATRQQRVRVLRTSSFTCWESSSLELENSLVWVEFTDRVGATFSRFPEPLPSRVSTSTPLFTLGTAATALWHPLQAVAVTRGSGQLLRLDLRAHHALLFTALNSGLDTTLSTCEAALFSGASVACQRCVEAAVTLPSSSVAALSCSTHHHPSRGLLVHMQLVTALAQTPVDAPVTEASLRAFTGILSTVEGELPSYVLSSLLAMPSSPAYLGALVDWAVSRSGGGVDARLFACVMHALLRNDNYFARSSFARMDAIVKERVLSRLGPPTDETWSAGAASFDYVSVRWTPLMNKWARVYGRLGQGPSLYRCFELLLAAVPAAENKIPCSFYVRLMGSLIDAHSATSLDAHNGDGIQFREGSGVVPDVCSLSADPWTCIVSVASRGVRLFGRGEEDMRALWVVLLKAALTLPPVDEDWRRVLTAYHLCATLGHQRLHRTDRGGFLQIIRLVSAALGRQSGAVDEAAETVRSLCVFFREQSALSFLWLLDGVGAVLDRLWEVQGPSARAAAESLFVALREAFASRGTAGVRLEANPALARAMERFGVSVDVAQPFWWRCGCGTELPATAKRCMTCLRRRLGASWLCAHCKAEHRTACSAQSCDCGAANPRLAAATNAKVRICGDCGECLKGVDALCSRCCAVEDRATTTTQCTCCGASRSANALYCPKCFAVPAERAPLMLWHCDNCEGFNFSMWSTCRRCHVQRRARCLRVPFVPWRCRCGGLNHPCLLHCNACSARSRKKGDRCYTCRGCKAVVAAVVGKPPHCSKVHLSSTVAFSVHQCPLCSTVHPRDQLVLYSPALSRHCMWCATAVTGAGAVGLDGGFYHCGLHQHINEHYPFRCSSCRYSEELQTGYHCVHCLQPRPEVALLLSQNTEAFYLWRCLQEKDSSETTTCGAWNYSWSSRCCACGSGRRDTIWECRAHAYAWQCAVCFHRNRPVDVLSCANCGRSTRPTKECNTCGLPHLSLACHT